jgi:hypothetical protein
MPTLRTITSGAAVALMLAALPAGASAAKAGVSVGLGDQSASMFDQKPFQALGLTKARYFIHWDAANDPYQLQQADIFVDQARQDGVKVFMTPSTNDLRLKKAKLPSVAAYKKSVGALVKRYRAMGVTEWGVWNEANHTSQPTYKSPKRAAQYFQAMYGLCSGCTIVALDLLDQTTADRYVASFYKSLSGSWRSRAKIVGIHNYSDVNRKHPTGTKRIIDAVRTRGRNTRAKFWLTETGGLVKFGSRGAFAKCSPSRAANRIKYMFTLAKKYDRYVDRLYAYAYWGTTCRSNVRFDAGLVNPNGTTRAGYTTFKNSLSGFRK